MPDLWPLFRDNPAGWLALLVIVAGFVAFVGHAPPFVLRGFGVALLLLLGFGPAVDEWVGGR